MSWIEEIKILKGFNYRPENLDVTKTEDNITINVLQGCWPRAFTGYKPESLRAGTRLSIPSQLVVIIAGNGTGKSTLVDNLAAKVNPGAYPKGVPEMFVIKPEADRVMYVFSPKPSLVHSI